MSNGNDPLVGTLVAGRYRVQKPLGEGGMGQVYLAVHEAIEKKVALKVLKREYSQKPDIVTRFQQEAISASRIKHPNVLDVFDFGQLEDGCFFLAMEFLEGHDLAHELEKRRVLSPEHGLRIAFQICRALAAAHAKGVVHRDMKPENVFLQRTADGEEIVKIVDFVIAQLRSQEEVAESEPKRRRLTKTGMIFGTPEYMSPEQAGGRKADLRVDVYAVGVILYEIFTGAVPHTGETFMAVLAAHLNDPVPPMRAVAPDVSVSAELEAVILRALSKRPEDRFQSMTDLAAALQAVPEAAGLAPMTRMGSLPDAPASRFASQPPPPAVPTAAQFPGAAGTQAQFGAAGAAAPAAHAATMVHPGAGAVTAVSATDGSVVAGPSHTQLGAEAAPSQGPRSGRLLVAALAVAAVAGVSVTLALRGGGSESGTGGVAAPPEARIPLASADPAGAVPPGTTPPTTATAPATAAPSPSASTAPAAPADRVRLEVVTEPAGAVVTKNGFQVCDTTPCELLAQRDEQLELEATKDRLKGKQKVLASRDQKVSIKLSAPAAPGPARTGPRMCEVEVDGLKILRPCP